MKASYLGLLLLISALALCNASGKRNFPTPQMGWNSWNRFACHVNHTVVESTADLIVSTGLADLGYNYVNIDDCWAWTGRNQDGQIQADPRVFPNGIKPVADYVHSKGLKIGIYSDAGTLTCAMRAGSLGHEEDDVATWASWGIDYLKYDNCNNQGIEPPIRYARMAAAIEKEERPIFFSLCEWGQDNVWEWGSKYGNSWRTTSDIKDNFDKMKYNFALNSLHPEAAGPTLGWNDPDMLEVGNGGMTTEEYKTHFALWAISKAPLLIGCDLTDMSADTMMILSNRELISMNQDALGVQVKCLDSCSDNSGMQVFGGPLANNEFVIAAINWGTTTVSNFSLDLTALTPSTSNTLKEVWSGDEVTVGKTYVVPSIPSHATAVYRITPTKTSGEPSKFEELLKQLA